MVLLSRTALIEVRPCSVVTAILVDCAPLHRPYIADEGNVMLLGYFVSTVNIGVARQWQPRGGGDADPAEQIYSVALGGEPEVEAGHLSTASVEVEVGIDGPEGAWTQFVRQVIREAVIDVQVEVEPVAWDSVQLAGLEMMNLDEVARAHDGNKLRPSRAGG